MCILQSANPVKNFLCIVGFLKECLLSAKGWDSLPILGVEPAWAIAKNLSNQLLRQLKSWA